jgi:hypothetical protein
MFPLFLRSPFFVQEHTSEEMERLFNCFLLPIDNPAEGVPDKYFVHTKVFLEKAYSEARLERALTKFGQLVEQFLQTCYYQRQDNERQRALDLAAVFREKQLASLYKKKLQKLKKDASSDPKESTDKYFFLYQIAKEEHEWLGNFNQGKSNLAVPELIENLDFFYYCERSEMLNRFLLQQLVSSLPMPANVLQTLGPLPNAEYFEQHSPLLQIRQKIQALYLKKDPNTEDFEVLRLLLKNHEQDLADATVSELYAFVRNFYAILSYNGKYEGYQAYHEIQKDNLGKGYFYLNDKIAPYSLLNIAKTALFLKKTAWARQFIESHRDRILSEDDHEDIYNLNVALCLFTEKKFDEALSKIPPTSKYPQYILLAKRLELMAYYELQSDLLPYKIDAFRKFLERTVARSISSVQWKLNINFVNLLQQLCNTTSKDAKRSARLIARINNKTSVSERRWLLEKARDLG